MSNREMQNLLTLAALQLERAADGYATLVRVRKEADWPDLCDLTAMIQEDRKIAANLKDIANSYDPQGIRQTGL